MPSLMSSMLININCFNSLFLLFHPQKVLPLLDIKRISSNTFLNSSAITISATIEEVFYQFYLSLTSYHISYLISNAMFFLSQYILIDIKEKNKTLEILQRKWEDQRRLIAPPIKEPKENKEQPTLTLFQPYGVSIPPLVNTIQIHDINIGYDIFPL